MAHVNICPGVDFVGIQNPNLRVFDIVMETKYGTSYNAFVVKGEKATALIETGHKTYYDAFVNNIKGVCDPASIDYIIINHSEPDHTGCLAQLVELCPKAKIYATQAGSMCIKAITNRSDLEIVVVKEGDSLDLGGKTLHFIPAPFLHWPDSMFTWLPEDKIAFTCDFLGCHYCEPLVFDYNIKYPAAYEYSFLEYYKDIMGPFKPYVVKGLQKLEALDIDFLCTSHGPVLTKQGRLEACKAQYLLWSEPQPKTNKRVPIFYCSAYGNTRQLAFKVKEGLESADPTLEVQCHDFVGSDMAQLGAMLNASDGFVIGSPTINRDALPFVWQLLACIDSINIAKRPAAAFGSYGWSGEAVPAILERLKAMRLSVELEGVRCNFTPTEDDLQNAFELGRQFAAKV